jgi:branched-chain amino acid transport system substrate-binding protein
MGMRWAPCLAVWALSLCATVWAAGDRTIVIGQSLPLTGSGFTVSNRILAGARAAVASVNARGGVDGVRLELITLDDANDPLRHEKNLHSLVTGSKALALINCLGSTACRVASSVAEQQGIPLIGPISGLRALRSVDLRNVFSIRPDSGREAEVLAGQLRALGTTRAVLLTDRPPDAESDTALLGALRASGMAVSVARVKEGDRLGIAAALKQSGDQQVQVLVLQLGLESSEAMGQLSAGELAPAPSLLASLAHPGLTTLTKLFRDRVIGFTTVVPHPELPDSVLVRRLTADADRYGVEALTYEGLESYVNTLVCIEAIRRAGSRANARAVAQSLANMGTYDVGGFVLDVGRPGRSASDWVRIGLRARSGHLLR